MNKLNENGTNLLSLLKLGKGLCVKLIKRLRGLRVWWKAHRPKHLKVEIKFKITLTRVMISSFLLVNFISHQQTQAQIPEQVKPAKAQQLKTLPELHTAAPAELSYKTYIAPPPAPPEPVQPVSVAQTYSGTGDSNLDWIFQHESSGDPTAINASSGACGLGQALPCSKMPCSLTDAACQISYFEDYAVSRYGSTYAAKLAWQSQGWW